jgi:hypothetical protein
MMRWINEADPSDRDPGITQAKVNDERTIYLISDANCDGPKAVDSWIRANHRVLFENELEGWYTDPDLWPKKRDLRTFRQWFQVEAHSVIEDTVGGPIVDDDL